MLSTFLVGAILISFAVLAFEAGCYWHARERLSLVEQAERLARSPLFDRAARVSLVVVLVLGALLLATLPGCSGQLRPAHLLLPLAAGAVLVLACRVALRVGVDRRRRALVRSAEQLGAEIVRDVRSWQPPAAESTNVQPGRRRSRSQPRTRSPLWPALVLLAISPGCAGRARALVARVQLTHVQLVRRAVGDGRTSPEACTRALGLIERAELSHGAAAQTMVAP